MLTAAIRKRLAAGWKRLTARERLVLSLVFFEGLTTTEAARALGCSVREVEHMVEGRLADLSRLVTAAKARARVAPRRLAA